MLFATIWAISVFFPPLVVPAQSPAKELQMTESWADPNFMLCEGVGIHGSGRVRVNAIGKTDGNSTKLRIFNVSVTNTQSSFSASGRIFWNDENGQDQSLNLVQPWYPSISNLGSITLVLPKGTTSDRGPGPWEGQKITVGPNNQVRIEIHTVFSQAQGSCSASFGEVWDLPIN